jgi:hypothetical protein
MQTTHARMHADIPWHATLSCSQGSNTIYEMSGQLGVSPGVSLCANVCVVCVTDSVNSCNLMNI